MSDDQQPYLTGDIPGIGGRARAGPEDFRVDERPLYLPCGEGEHLYVRVTKRSLATPELVSRLSSWLGVKARCIGVAGLKDASAVTSQVLSIQGARPEDLARVRINDQILALDILGRHRNRLRKGHHAGNTFRLVVRDVRPDAEVIVPQVLHQLVRTGVPNYFGPQRQGRTGRNYELGAVLLRDPERRARMSRSKRTWYLHAYQSFLFNQIVARRIDRLDQVLVGDWAMKLENGACFLVENAEAEQPRADRFEISPTGILFGSRAPWATGEPGNLEQAVAEAAGTTPESLRNAATECGFRGERRALRVKLENPDWSVQDRILTVSFSLPPGAYATNVLRELMKT